MAAVLQLADASSKWSTVPVPALGDALTCPVCADGFDGGASAAHGTCLEGHLCCARCFARLATDPVVCPLCRRHTPRARLGPVAGDAMLGVLVKRGLLRWACAAECGFGGAMAAVLDHARTCASVAVACAVCGEAHARGALAAHVLHAHAASVVSGAGRLDLRPHAPVYVRLPLGSVLCVVRDERGTCVRLESVSERFERLAPFADVAVVLVAPVAPQCRFPSVRVVEQSVARLVPELRVSHAPDPEWLRVETRACVRLCYVPEGAMVRYAGALMVHHSSVPGLSVLAPLRASTAVTCAPHAALVEPIAPRPGQRCWALDVASERCRAGTLLRYDGLETAVVRLDDASLLLADRTLCGRLVAPY